MKKLLTLFVAVLLVLTATVTMLSLVSCGPETSGGQGGQGGHGGFGDEGGEARIPLDLPDKNYETSNGKTPFNILEWSVDNQNTPGQSWIPWEEGHVEEEDGDMLGAAVFRRNAWVEEEYGVDISKEYVSLNGSPTFIYRITTNANTSADEFQLITSRTLEIFSLIQQDLYFDMNEYKDTILHTDQPWWVQDSVTSFTLGSHLYVASTEMLLRDKGATATLYFNQTMAKDYEEDLPNFFKLVDDGEWTFEQMDLACELVAHSDDGNGEMDSTEDIWGCYGADDAVYYMYNAFGNKFAHIDKFGFVDYDFGEEDSIKIMQDIFQDFIYADYNFNLEMHKGLLEDGQHLFADGKALFNSGLVKETTTKLKNMEDLYGILPHPMLDEDQEGYSALVWVHHDSSVGIPAHTADQEMSAIILEALSWESYYSVYPTFYETILLNRAAKDKDSKRMLEIIFESRSYDPGQYYDNGTNSSGLHGGDGLLRLSATGSYNIASLWERFGETVMFNMEKVNGWIAGNEN